MCARYAKRMLTVVSGRVVELSSTCTGIGNSMHHAPSSPHIHSNSHTDDSTARHLHTHNTPHTTQSTAHKQQQQQHASSTAGCTARPSRYTKLPHNRGHHAPIESLPQRSLSRLLSPRCCSSLDRHAVNWTFSTAVSIRLHRRKRLCV